MTDKFDKLYNEAMGNYPPGFGSKRDWDHVSSSFNEDDVEWTDVEIEDHDYGEVETERVTEFGPITGEYNEETDAEPEPTQYRILKLTGNDGKTEYKRWMIEKQPYGQGNYFEHPDERKQGLDAVGEW